MQFKHFSFLSSSFSNSYKCSHLIGYTLGAALHLTCSLVHPSAHICGT